MRYYCFPGKEFYVKEQILKIKNDKIIFPHRLFISGTDTGIGKSVVSAILLSGLSGKYWKPIQSGLEDITDTQWIKEKTGLPDSHFYRETYRLNLPLSPHASAAADGIKIHLDAFEMPACKEDEYLFVEGAGGLMVPLNEKDMMTDLIKKLNIPVLLVSRSSLGTINHTLLSLNLMRQECIEIFGVVMSGEKNPGNREAIEYYGNVKVIAEIGIMEDISPVSLKECFDNEITGRKGFLPPLNGL